MDNLLHLSVTSCIQCGDLIKGDPERTICDVCVDAALEEARFRTREEAVSRACGAVEPRELAEVIDINRKQKREEKKIIQEMVKEAEALDW